MITSNCFMLIVLNIQNYHLVNQEFSYLTNNDFFLMKCLVLIRFHPGGELISRRLPVTKAKQAYAKI